jgi:hypothetical protein
MTPDMLIAAALILPLVIAAGIAAAGKVPNLREGITLVGAVGLFAIVVQLTLLVAAGQRPELYIGEAIPGLAFAFKLEPLGALFAFVASGLWIVNSVYSIGYMRGNRERNQTRFYFCFAIALCGAMGVAMAGNLFTLFIFYEVLTLSTYPLVAHKGDAAAQRGAMKPLGGALDGVRAARMRDQVGVLDRTLVVVESEELLKGQKRGIAAALRKARVALRALERREGKRALARDTLEQRIAAILRREHLRDFVEIEYGGTEAAATFRWRVDAARRLQHGLAVERELVHHVVWLLGHCLVGHKGPVRCQLPALGGSLRSFEGRIEQPA